MSDYICKIEKLANGYEVELYDPKIAKANTTGKSRYRDPMVGHACMSVKDVCKFLMDNLEKAGANDEYSSSFSAYVEKDED